MAELDTITALVAPLVGEAGYELYDVQRNGGTLAVLVQGPDGVDIDELSALSRAVSATLDEHDPIPGKYTLEVSSPGVERRLRREEHFAGAVGETVNIRTLAGPSGRRRIVGELQKVDGDLLTVDDQATGTTCLRIAEIEKART
ncbi:MAG: ribosome maturation factor RimP, partial [Actinomycetota bacterium]|nr:ribosome maturation factor RimP [Actinomycetota bacterium]